LEKWIWHLSLSKGGHWKEILESKYGGWRSLKEQRFLISNSLWLRDLKEVWKLEIWERSFEDNSRWEVGNEKELFFW